jgi:hypothetical protein
MSLSIARLSIVYVSIVFLEIDTGTCFYVNETRYFII